MQTIGQRKFCNFVGERGLRWTEVAKALGVTKGIISTWHLGNHRPEHKMRLAIERWTNGQITPNDWLTTSERRLIETVTPCSAGVTPRSVEVSP